MLSFFVGDVFACEFVFPVLHKRNFLHLHCELADLDQFTDGCSHRNDLRFCSNDANVDAACLHYCLVVLRHVFDSFLRYHPFTDVDEHHLNFVLAES
jgi:hypothetical protein